MTLSECIACIITDAIEAGTIQGILVGDVCTFANATQEWEGRAKCYIVETNATDQGDLTSATGVGYTERELTISVIGQDAETAISLRDSISGMVHNRLDNPTGLGVLIKDWITSDTKETPRWDGSEFKDEFWAVEVLNVITS